MSFWGNVLGGIGSAILGRSSSRSSERAAREMSEREIAFEREAIGLRANEDRRTQRETALLDEWMRQNRRSEISRGSKNFTQFAGSAFKDYKPAAAPNQRQVTPDEFINSGGIVGQLAAPATATTTPSNPAQAPVVGLDNSLIGRLRGALR